MSISQANPPIQIPNAEDQYFLLAIPLDPTPSEPKSPPQRLRFHSAAHPIVVLHPDPPKLIRFHTQSIPDTPSQIIATSWNERHEGRWWGIVLHQSDEAGARGWEEVRMLEGKGDARFQWVKLGGEGRDELVCVSSEEGEGKWAGWMVCDWSMGLKQVFWVTQGGKELLPGLCQRVRIVRERVWGQPDRPEVVGEYAGSG